MISKLFRKRPESRGPAQASIPSGERVYAIGDIHGRLDLLDDLLAQIEADERARGGAPATLIFLGDLIDRGAESAQVVERLRLLSAERPGTRFLLGNHEEVFLASIAGDVRALKLFVRIGGRETILSYGVPSAVYRDCDYDELIPLMQDSVPQEHIDFIRDFEDIIIIGDYAFVHAGIRPGQDLAAQKLSDLRWIRDDFLKHAGEHEKVIVHGHSISEAVELLPHRIGIDTGAFASGKLTAIGIEGDARWILQTDAPALEAQAPR